MKLVIAFVAGILLAGGIAYFVVANKEPAPAPAAQVTIPEPAPQVPAVEPAPPPVEEVKPVPVEPKHTPKAPVKKAKKTEPARPPVSEPKPAETVAKNQEPTPAPAAALEPPPFHQAPPPPPEPKTVTVPAGTLLNVRLSDALSSDRNQVGDTFSAVLDKPLVVDGFVIAERGARVDGRVVESRAAGRVKGTSAMAIELLSLKTADGQTMKLSTETWEKQGETSKGGDVAKVGAAAGIGAAIGAIAGGGKGAGIGAAIGGAAGTGGVLATRGKAVRIPVETRITFKIKEPVTLTEKLH